MLTKADDFPIHQTPEPIAFSGTDRNFYDRYFFNCQSADGSLFFAVAFGVYPQLGIMDAAVSVVFEDKQYVLRASRRIAGGERMDVQVGPISIDIVEPLYTLAVTIAPNDGPLSGKATFVARHPAFAEPRFTRRIGARAFMDYTRLTQNGAWSGKLNVDGRTLKLSPETHLGTRDRSWGTRPVGAPDSQPPPAGSLSQFFWLWTPSNFKDAVVFLHTNDDAYGRPWNRRARVEIFGEPEREYEHVDFGYDWIAGTRRLRGARFTLKGCESGAEAVLSFKIRRHFYMPGIGYMHPTWGHGTDHGDLAVEHEIIDLKSVDDLAPQWMHIQGLADAELQIAGKTRKGAGVVEQLFIGPHAPTGMTGLLDPAKTVS